MRSVASCQEHEEESPGNTERHTFERKAGGDVGGDVEEKNRLPADSAAGKGEKAG